MESATILATKQIEQGDGGEIKVEAKETKGGSL
jgi:hypothetical protein